MITYKMSAKSFLANWQNGRKYCDIKRPGCYRIRIYPRFGLVHTHWYVGKSMDVYKDIYRQLTGYGDSGVHTHIHYKKERAVIRVYFCNAEQLNRLERTLIERGGNMDISFNRLLGGGGTIR